MHPKDTIKYEISFRKPTTFGKEMLRKGVNYLKVIKLGKSEMRNQSEVKLYFEQKLPQLSPKGRFDVTGGKSPYISDLRVGETLVFTHSGKILLVAKSASTRCISEDPRGFTELGEPAEYPHYFLIDLDSIIWLAEPIHRYSLSEHLPRKIDGPAWQSFTEEEYETANKRCGLNL